MNLVFQTPEPRRTDSITQAPDKPQKPSDAKQQPATVSAPVTQSGQPADASKQSPVVTTKNERQTTEQTVSVRSLPTIDTRRDWVDFSQILLTLFLLGIAIWQIVLLKRTVDATKNAANAAKDNATAASDNAAAAVESARTAAAALATHKEIERAYISLTHQKVFINYMGTTDGLRGPDMSRPYSIGLTVVVRNTGRTPGDLLGGFIGWRIGESPGIPDVTRVLNNLTPAFLLATKTVSFGLTIREDAEAMERLIVRRDGSDHLWLIGEVDYADRFGQLHTAGYGRRFNPDPPSFVFTSETGPFNYDRPMSAHKKASYGKSEGQPHDQP